MSDHNITPNLPRLGQAVHGSTSGQPIMVLFDLLSRRWALGIIWQLSGKQLTFRELAKACGDPSPTILNTRLKELRATSLVIHAPGGYALTDEGETLYEMLLPLGAFAKEWVHHY